jgi:hypothetical protein
MMNARSIRMAAVLAAFVLSAQPGVSAAAGLGGAPNASNVPNAPNGSYASAHLGSRSAGGVIPDHFVGFSIEWSLAERYMAPSARPAFVNLLRNLGTGVLRLGGSSQDVMPFDPASPNTDKVITPQDLEYVRATMDGTNGHGGRPSWQVVLGTAMSPPSASRPFVSPEHARTFVEKGVGPAFSGPAARDVAGIELGNEPDLSYGSGLDRYLGDLATYSGAVERFPVIAPSTSEDILPWTDIDQRTVPTRYFWDWPAILDTAEQGHPAYASDHFYPLARTCAGKPYRCPSIPALLSGQHMDSLDYQVYTHAREAADHHLAYRLEETNTAAGRGADGVSNVAASATYALDLMFHTACPQPPDAPSANTSCGTGAIGLNFHNAEVRAFFFPQEGNAYYNAIDYDPTDAVGAPTPAPVYYATLLFSRFAQGTRGLRPVRVSGDASLDAWQVEGRTGDRRLFLINKGDHPVTFTVAGSGETAQVDRMTPYDPTGAGKALDAAQVRIDGRQVAADGTWPGFHPAAERIRHGHLTITLAAGEASVISLR